MRNVKFFVQQLVGGDPEVEEATEYPGYEIAVDFIPRDKVLRVRAALDTAFQVRCQLDVELEAALASPTSFAREAWVLYIKQDSVPRMWAMEVRSLTGQIGLERTGRCWVLRDTWRAEDFNADWLWASWLTEPGFERVQDPSVRLPHDEGPVDDDAAFDESAFDAPAPVQPVSLVSQITDLAFQAFAKALPKLDAPTRDCAVEALAEEQFGIAIDEVQAALEAVEAEEAASFRLLEAHRTAHPKGGSEAEEDALEGLHFTDAADVATVIAARPTWNVTLGESFFPGFVRSMSLPFGADVAALREELGPKLRGLVLDPQEAVAASGEALLKAIRAGLAVAPTDAMRAGASVGMQIGLDGAPPVKEETNDDMPF